MRRKLLLILLTCVILCGLPQMVAAQASPSFTVVLDAGHGGKDPGCIGSNRTHQEKDIALAITLEVGKMLRANNPDIRLVYTRQSDVFVQLGRRAEIANEEKANLFVSIHVNALPRNSRNHAYGVQSYTLSLEPVATNLEVEKRENSVITLEGDAAKKYNYDKTAESDIMFELMQDQSMQESVSFARIAQNEMIYTAGRKDMGVRQANLAVLRLTYMPSVLLEVGYISTPEEEQFLSSESGRRLLANSIYNAIVKYYKLKKK